MLKRSIALLLVVAGVSAAAFGQSPDTKPEPTPLTKAFAFSFDGNGGYLGVQTVEVTSDNFARYGLKQVRGVAVDKVMENSPAKTAGIQPGDVIVRFNGDEVTSTRKFSRLVGEVAPDHSVPITVVRNGSEQELNATIGKREIPKFENGNFNFAMPEGFEKLKIDELKVLPPLKDMPEGQMPKIFGAPGGEGKAFTWTAGSNRQIGVGINELTKQLAEHFGVDGGVLVNSVRENSPASRAGLIAGDIIVDVNGKAVKGNFDLVRTINEKKEGDVQITFVRDRNRQTISVTPEIGKDSGFIFRTGDDDSSPEPGVFKLTRPAKPMVAPSPLTTVISGPIT